LTEYEKKTCNYKSYIDTIKNGSATDLENNGPVDQPVKDIRHFHRKVTTGTDYQTEVIISVTEQNETIVTRTRHAYKLNA